MMAICLVEMLLLSLVVFVSVASPFSNRHIGFYSNHRIISSYSIKSTAKIKSRITYISSCDNSLPHKKQEISIIGPLLNLNAPLTIGSSIVLDPPTPLQWRTIEASVEAHHRVSMNADSTITNEIQTKITSDRLNLNTMATTDKCPLVAVLHRGAKDYATIAAIVGIVTKKDAKIDTGDAESFRESLASSTSIYYSNLSSVRLMAVGRGKLSLFNNKYLEDKEDDSPILVARMELLLDSNENGKKPTSSVHALNRLSTYAQRINFLHKDRQRIVRGLQAAQSRLERAMETWEDWDNIGSLNNDFKTTKLVEEDKKDIFLNEFLQEYDYKQKDTHSTPTRSLPLSPNATRCIELDNYGLTTSSAYVDLTSMSKVLLEKLEHFYSPTRLETEDFEYECLSWCALQSLQIYLSPSEIHDALYICTNTCERLEILYHAMIKHKIDLHEIARAKSTELMNCGEECDLF
jgi:hypothetical protein